MGARVSKDFQFRVSGFQNNRKLTALMHLSPDARISSIYIHYSKKLKEHFVIMIFIERYPLKRCQGCVKLIASKVNWFLKINDLSEVQLCMSSNSWT